MTIFERIIRKFMGIPVQGYIYRSIIDPLLSRLHKSVVEHIEPSQRVIDIACGTGALSIAAARKATYVTAIDLSEDMIITARRGALKQRIYNIRFEICDASDLSAYKDRQFDVAVTSMSIHQFNSDFAIKVISSMKRISPVVIIADYNHHMPRGYGRQIALGIERLAGGDHYRNFRDYIRKGGIHWFARETGLFIRSEVTVSGGVFVITICN
jgi:SAM-dependent methyltransferase